MTPEEQMLATILSRSARALAGYAASDELSDDPAATFDRWQTILAGRLEDMAVALSTQRPAIFVEQVLWTEALLKARGVPAKDFRSKLDALSRVVAEQVPAELTPLAADYFDRALAQLGKEPIDPADRLMARTADEQLAAKYLVAILEGDRREASRLILAAADGGMSATDLYLRVLQPAQQELGRMWMLGEINVAEEHFATTTSRLVMAQLHARSKCQPSNGKTLVAAAVAGNLHDLGIQMVGDLFEIAGWKVIQLGADVPAADLAQAVEFYAADAVALAVSLATHLPSLQHAIAAVRSSEAGQGVTILAGGYKFTGAEELARSFGADAYASNAAKAVEIANALVGLPKPS